MEPTKEELRRQAYMDAHGEYARALAANPVDQMRLVAAIEKLYQAEAAYEEVLAK